MSFPYSLDSAPLAKSWIYSLDASQAIAQCQAFGIVPTPHLRLNRKLLSNFMDGLMTNRLTQQSSTAANLMEGDLLQINTTLASLPSGSQPPPPSPSTGSLFADSSLAWDYGPPYNHQSLVNNAQLPQAFITTAASAMPRTPFSLRYVTATSTRPSASVGGPIRVASFAATQATTSMTTTAVHPQQQPPQQSAQTDQWASLIQATATAVGAQMAAVLQANQPPPRSVGDGGNRVLADLVKSVPETSGSDSIALVRFLASIQRIADLSLGDQDSLLLSLLNKTSGQLRSLWIRAVTNRIPIGELIPTLLNFFVPSQLRHSLVTQLVYRAQAVNESIPEYVTDLQLFASLLLPDLSERDILDAAMHGLHPATRARLAGLPTPAVLEDLLALSPRLELIRQLEPTPVRPTPSTPHYQDRQNHLQGPDYYRRNHQRGNVRPNGHVNNGTYQNSNPHRFQPQPFTPQGHYRNHTAGNLNSRGGRRW